MEETRYYRFEQRPWNEPVRLVWKIPDPDEEIPVMYHDVQIAVAKVDREGYLNATLLPGDVAEAMVRTIVSIFADRVVERTTFGTPTLVKLTAILLVDRSPDQ